MQWIYNMAMGQHANGTMGTNEQDEKREEGKKHSDLLVDEDG